MKTIWGQRNERATRKASGVGIGSRAGVSAQNAKKNGSRSSNKFEFRLPLRLIRDAVLLRFQRPLFRRPVSGPISLMVIGFPHYRLRNIASVQTRYWSSHPTIVVRLIRSGLRLCFTGFFQSSIERSFYLSCEKQHARFDYLQALDRSSGSLLTGR